MIAAVWLVLGLLALISGAEMMVRAGTRLAARMGIPPILIGLTVVAVGTSTPELAVGIEAALQGNGSLAVGNIAGTNIVNILLILGLSALLMPLALELRSLRFDLPWMIGAALALVVMAWDGLLSRMEGVALVASSAIYTLLLVRGARRDRRDVKATVAAEHSAEEAGPAEIGLVVNLAALVAGIAVVVVGADWLLDGAVGLASRMGVSDAFIGLTVVAIGTSSPELVTTVISTLRQARDIAVGNLLGSSVYNIVLILGFTMVAPSAGIGVEPVLFLVDIPVMVLAAIACVPTFVSGRSLTRLEGALFVSAYFVYLGYLLVART